MIKSRHRKGKARTNEHWLSVKSASGGFIYHDWYTVAELIAEFPENNLVSGTVISRIHLVNKGQSKTFNTLWDVVSMPCHKRATNNVIKTQTPEFFEFINVMSLFKVSSLSARI